MIGLFILGLVLIAVSTSALLRVLSLRRVRTSNRLESIAQYGFGVTHSATTLPASSARPSEFVGRLGAIVATRFGGVSEEDMRNELLAAGMYSTSARTLLGYRVLCGIGLAIFVVVIGTASPVAILLGLLMLPAGWLLPLFLVRRRARRRLELIDRSLPDLIDLLVVTIEAGLGFGSALRVAAEELKGPLNDELRLTLQEQTMGLAIDEALANLLRRSDTGGMRAFVRSLTQGERLGISIGQIMRNLAVDMRKRRRKEAEERAQKAPIKMLFPLVFLVFPSMFIVLLVPALIGLLNTF